nr:hypothetical protein Iba_chr12aCG0900 [Ipomoea batatas]GMD71622.1 hypothetical protein Iba_chr12fCG0660 [Ipomoea batatas]
MHAYIQKKKREKSFASKPSTCPWLEKEGSLLSLRSDKGLGGARSGFGSTTASFGTAEGGLASRRNRRSGPRERYGYVSEGVY